VKIFEVTDGINVSFYSPEEYETILDSLLKGEFVAAIEC
jgi:hypothetical protein